MRKKIVTLMLSLAMVLSLTACGGNGKDEKKDDSSTSAKTETSESADDAASDDADDAENADDAASDDASDANADAAGTEASDSLLSLLSQLDVQEVSDAIVGTEWGMSGGIVDGVEMEQEEYDASLEQYGGTLNIVFDDAENISMVQGGGTLKGTYTSVSDNYLMEIIFDNNGTELKYAGLFANVDGTKVLMLFSDDTGKNAIYFTQN